MILARTIVVTDAFARANVLATLAGRGAPAGITSCVEAGDSIVFAFDTERTAAELIDALVAIATAFVPARAAEIDDLRAVVTIAARGLNEPVLDSSRIIETYLP